IHHTGDDLKPTDLHSPAPSVSGSRLADGGRRGRRSLMITEEEREEEGEEGEEARLN
ncbi:hypothetical protein LINGRAHAP2_LOCUS5916, partial [Linum grandiflorum]